MTVNDSEQMNKMPTECRLQLNRGWGSLEEVVCEGTEYILKHNNPDYYVIKKSDVQGGVWRYEINYGPHGEEYYANVWCGGHLVGNLPTHFAIQAVNAVNALIAQSNMVTIPRNVLEGMRDNKNPYDMKKESWHWGGYERYLEGKNQMLDEILNYKKAGE